jgi:Cell Wall Hydrolase
MTVAESQEIFLPALCIWREMRGESGAARLGCYWVIRNRANDARNRWPKTLYEVVTQPWQFSSFNKGDANAGLMPHRGIVADWQAWQEICAMCDQPGEDPVDGANSYEALPESAPKPGWANEAQLVRQLGGTRFYKI